MRIDELDNKANFEKKVLDAKKKLEELQTLCNNRRIFVKNEALPRLLDANLQHAVLDQIL
mgnify:CR=1 FL=1